MPDGPTVPVGSTVTWTYNVTNPTGVALTSVSVTDNIAGRQPDAGAVRRLQRRRHQPRRPAGERRDLGVHRQRHRHRRPVQQHRHGHRHAGDADGRHHPGRDPGDRHQPRPLLRHAVHRRSSAWPTAPTTTSAGRRTPADGRLVRRRQHRHLDLQRQRRRRNMPPRATVSVTDNVPAVNRHAGASGASTPATSTPQRPARPRRDLEVHRLPATRAWSPASTASLRHHASGGTQATFNDGSDQADFQFTDSKGNVVLDFLADYVSQGSAADPAAPRSAILGYGTLGLGGDGKLNSGSASNILASTRPSPTTSTSPRPTTVSRPIRPRPAVRSTPTGTT